MEKAVPDSHSPDMLRKNRKEHYGDGGLDTYSKDTDTDEHNLTEQIPF